MPEEHPVADHKTIVKLEGGHSTVVKQPIHELAHEIQRAREEKDGLPGIGLLFIQSPQHGDNGLVIDPDKVVALIRA